MKLVQFILFIYMFLCSYTIMAMEMDNINELGKKTVEAQVHFNNNDAFESIENEEGLEYLETAAQFYENKLKKYILSRDHDYLSKTQSKIEVTQTLLLLTKIFIDSAMVASMEAIKPYAKYREEENDLYVDFGKKLGKEWMKMLANTQYFIEQELLTSMNTKRGRSFLTVDNGKAVGDEFIFSFAYMKASEYLINHYLSTESEHNLFQLITNKTNQLIFEQEYSLYTLWSVQNVSNFLISEGGESNELPDVYELMLVDPLLDYTIFFKSCLQVVRDHIYSTVAEK